MTGKKNEQRGKYPQTDGDIQMILPNLLPFLLIFNEEGST